MINRKNPHRLLPILCAGMVVLSMHSAEGRDLQIFPVFSFYGSTNRPETDVSVEGRRTTDLSSQQSRILSRAAGFGLELRGESGSGNGEPEKQAETPPQPTSQPASRPASAPASVPGSLPVEETGAFRYSLDGEIRFNTAQFQRSSAAAPTDLAAPSGTSRSSPVLLFTGPTWAGVRFVRYASLLFGTVSGTGNDSPDSLRPDAALRNSIFPGMHLEIQLPGHYGSIRLSPVTLLDSPGRVAPPDAPFTESIREGLALRFSEGFASSAVSPDRFARGGRIAIQVDSWTFDAGFRSSSLPGIGPSPDSFLFLQQSEFQGGYMGHPLYLLFSVRRASGYLQVTGGDRTSIDGFEARLATGYRIGPFFTELFALQSQPPRRHRGDGTDPSDRLGWIDVGGSPADLPVLGGAYGILLHPVPCAMTTLDRCDGLLRSDAVAGFRNAGRYGDFTIGAEGSHWRGILRAGILVPSADVQPASPGNKPLPYRDYAEVAAELQAIFPGGSFHIAWGGEHCRSAETGRRVLETQALSIFARIRFPTESEETNRRSRKP